MVTSIWEDIKQQFRYGNMLTQIILVNTGVFVFIKLLSVLLFFIYQGGWHAKIQQLLTWFMASSDVWHTIFRPWTPITYMFLHEGIWHYAFNMLILYYYGRIFQDLLGTRKTLTVYLLGGLMGFCTYFLSSFLLPDFIGKYLLGASAGVWGVAMATTVLRPEYPIHLILIGQVRLKYITLVLALLSIFSIVGNNTGGEIAHIGGMLAGWLFMYLLQEKGQDISVPFNKFWDKFTGFFLGLFGKPKLKTRTKSTDKSDWDSYRHGRGKKAPSDTDDTDEQTVIDEILEKIKRSGYDSLTKEEKETLFKASNKK